MTRRSYGTGSLTEIRPGVWRLRVYTGIHPVTGRPTQTSRTIHTAKRGGKSEAQAALDALRAEVMGPGTMDANSTLSDLLDRWLAHLERQDKAPATIETYRHHIDKRIRPRLGALKLYQVTAQELDRFYVDLLETLSVGTIQLHHSILTGALSQAVKWDMVGTNAAKRASPPKGRTVDREVLSTADVVRLIRAAEEDDQDYAMAISLMAFLGCRRGEVCGLRWEDVDWTLQTVTIRRSLGPAPGGGQREGSTKTHRGRVVSVEGWPALHIYQDLQRERVGREPDGWLVSPNGGVTSMDPKRVSEYVPALGRKLKPPLRVTPHMLRHWAASYLTAEGTNVRTVSNRLGHASTQMTLDTYTHALPAQDVEAARILAEALSAT